MGLLDDVRVGLGVFQVVSFLIGQRNLARILGGVPTTAVAIKIAFVPTVDLAATFRSFRYDVV